METIENFEKRSYVNFPDGIVLVWPTEKAKMGEATTRNKAEIWDIPTLKRYMEILEKDENT